MSNPIGFGFLLLTMVQLYVRPVYFHPALATVPFYQIFIIPCLLLSLPGLLQQLTPDSIARNPTTAYVLGFFGLFFLSSMANLGLDAGLTASLDFFKVVLFYLLIIANVTDHRRLQQFMVAYVLATIVSVGLALLSYYRVMEVPGYKPLAEGFAVDPVTRKLIPLYRLSGPLGSNTADPNDLCVSILPGVLFAGYWAFSTRGLFGRTLAVLVTGFLLWGVIRTQSRGGLLGLMVGIMVLFWARFGLKKSIVLGVLAIAGLMAVAGARQTSFSTSSGTGATRVITWMECIGLMKQRPILGVGPDVLPDILYYTAHNSYLQAFTEIGVLGGILFTGLVFTSNWLVYRLRPSAVAPEAWRFQPTVLATGLACATSLIALSRAYLAETFAIIGMGAAYYHIMTDGYRLADVRSDVRMFMRICLFSFLFIAFVYFQVRYSF